MLTETVIGIVFAGNFAAAAMLPFLAWQQSVVEAFRASSGGRSAHNQFCEAARPSNSRFRRRRHAGAARTLHASLSCVGRGRRRQVSPPRGCQVLPPAEGRSLQSERRPFQGEGARNEYSAGSES